MAKVKNIDQYEELDQWEELNDSDEYEEDLDLEELEDELADDENLDNTDISFEDELVNQEEDLAEDVAETSEGSSKAEWYVVHTYSGHDNKVKVNIEKIVENRGMQDLVLDIVVPTEDHVEIKNGQRKVKTRKMFPGYVLVK